MQSINTKIIVINDEILLAHDIDEMKVFLKNHIIKMKKMLHVPELNANLFSISTFDKKDFNVLFDEKSVCIRSENITIAIGIMRRKMYFFCLAEKILLISEVHGAAFEAALKVVPILENFILKTGDI